MRRGRRIALWAAALAVWAPAAVPAVADSRLAEEIGRNDTRIYSSVYRLEPGVTVAGAALPERLERLGYRRLRARPAAPGEYFWGHEVLWIYRRAHRALGRDRAAELLGLELRRESGEVLAVFASGDAPGERRDPKAPWLEPELLAESFAANRAPRRPLALDELPDDAWRAVLAIEDARFFDHSGVDARAVARALLRNAKAGKVVQGGSTITQQLIKNRDLSPKRSLGRKMSEALRALALEAEYDKREILEAYLDRVYFGHLQGVELYGLGAAARAFFSVDARRLDLGQAALLAAVIQGPNLLSPVRNPERALARQRLVLDRMLELGWAEADEVAAARRRLPPLAPSISSASVSPQFLAWVREVVEREAPGRLRDRRGVVVETGLDPVLQSAAESAVRGALERLRRRSGAGAASFSAALVALDARTGQVVAHVGGDPRRARDEFDRARKAQRQPGSAVKPLVLLEAFDRCGARDPLFPARRVSDRPLTIRLPSGDWSPENPDRRSRATVNLRQALVESLNVPIVRTARWCGFEPTARRFRRAGLSLPDPPPPSFVLGSVETSPLDLAAAFTPFAAAGDRVEPHLVRRIERPSGRGIEGFKPSRRRVAGEGSAYLVRDLLRSAVEHGTASGAKLAGREAYGKTGTSSGRRDAWFVGGSGPLVAALWIGRDDDAPLAAGGGTLAAPAWGEFMAVAAGTRPRLAAPQPRGVERLWVQDETGLLVRGPRQGAHEELFLRRYLPPRRRIWRADEPLPVIE